MEQPIGPVIIDVMGTEVSQEEMNLLQHPLVGGVVLFSRNYENRVQLIELCQAIRSSRKTPLLITVDHEGGRVQRFRDGFTRLPPMGEIGRRYLDNAAAGIKMAESCGAVMATELLSVGIDLSFAPVVDLNKELNTVIGDRAFHSDPDIVIRLAGALISGMKSAGMTATIKHFPGHGSVNLDSHVAMPIDTRSFENIAREDMRPFAELIQAGVQAVMPAHIVFPEVDEKPVGFSKKWLQDILRKQLQFSGVIFSDDLNMEGAGFAGNYADRALAALDAGCDMVLICNNRDGAVQILDKLGSGYSVDQHKFQLLQGKCLVNSY